MAHPLLVYINDELNSEARKFTFLCGHDSNIASVNAALEVEDYELPNSIEKRLQLVVSWYLKNGWTKKEMSLFQSIWYIRALNN